MMAERIHLVRCVCECVLGVGGEGIVGGEGGKHEISPGYSLVIDILLSAVFPVAGNESHFA